MFRSPFFPRCFHFLPHACAGERRHPQAARHRPPSVRVWRGREHGARRNCARGTYGTHSRTLPRTRAHARSRTAPFGVCISLNTLRRFVGLQPVLGFRLCLNVCVGYIDACAWLCVPAQIYVQITVMCNKCNAYLRLYDYDHQHEYECPYCKTKFWK